MIMEELAKLDDSKRKTAAVLMVLVVAGICYFAITRDSVTKLKAANESYAGLQAEYAGTENQQSYLLDLQKRLAQREKWFQKCQQQYFSRSGAVQFFENINTMALAYKLKPMSRVMSELKDLVDDKGDGAVDGEKAKSKPQFLRTQSVKITVAGNYFDIVDFLNQLTDRAQKVCVTDLRITLRAGEKAKPKASFKIILAIDSSKETEQ